MKTIQFILKSLVMIIAGFLSTTQLFSQNIQTSQGTFGLVPVSDLVDAPAARSAKRVAELAIPAIISDSKKIAQQREAFQAEFDAYKNDLSSYDTDLKLYNISLESYNQKFDSYERDLASYDAELQPHNAAIAAHNSIAADSRSQTEYNRLLACKSRLDTWLVSLDIKKADLDVDLIRLDNFKADVDYAYASLNSRYEELKYQLNAIHIEMERAYDQLEKLIQYSKDCNTVLENWSEPILITYNLNTELEKLKALSNKGWN